MVSPENMYTDGILYRLNRLCLCIIHIDDNNSNHKEAMNFKESKEMYMAVVRGRKGKGDMIEL